MKKIFMLLLAIGTAAIAFAQDKAPAETPKPKSELYGKFRLDYDLTQAMVEGATPLFGGFNVDRARFGFNTLMLDNLKALLEVEFKPSATLPYGSFELRIAEADWKIIDLFTLSAGRMYEAFAPKSEVYGSRFDGAGVLLDFKVLKVLAQAGNDKDKGILGDALTVMPGVVFTAPIDGVGLEIGANGKVKFSTGALATQLWANAYASLKLAGLSALVNFDANRLDTSAAMYLDLFGEFSYKIDWITPGIKVFCYDLANNPTDGKTSHFDIEPYINLEFVKGFIINPRFTLSNLIVPSGSTLPLTWKFTLRFEWNPKAVF